MHLIMCMHSVLVEGNMVLILPHSTYIIMFCERIVEMGKLDNILDEDVSAFEYH